MADFSPDGKRVACAGDKVRVLDIAGLEVQERAVLDHNQALFCFAPDSQSLATLGEERLCIWNLNEPQAPARTTLKAPAWKWTALTFAAEGQIVFAADQLGRMAGWNVASGKRITRPGRTELIDPLLWQMPGMVRELVVSHDGRYLASANSDGSVYILRIDALIAAETGK